MVVIYSLSIAVLCLFLHISEGINTGTVRSEENESVTLTCTRGGITDFITKLWYRGYFSSITISPSSSAVIYNQVRSGAVGNSGARYDMSLDTSTFSLTIGRVQLEDDSYFTCRVATLERTFYESVQLNVYIQPVISLTGLKTTTFKENTTVTVTCTVDRVYPELELGTFHLRWGEQGNTSVGTINADKSYRYTALSTRTLTREDDQTLVTCTVIPRQGQPDSISKTITVQYPIPPAPNSFLPAAIGGAVGGGALLITIFVLGCIYMRKRSNVNAKDIEPARPPSTTYELPDIMNHSYEDVVLPGAAATTSENGQYETLQRGRHVQVTFDHWLMNNNISAITKEKLVEHDINTIGDIEQLSHPDMIEIGLSVGERNRIKKAIQSNP